MNFGSIPELKSPHDGFLLLSVMAIGRLLLFRRVRWLYAKSDMRLRQNVT